MTCGDVKPLFNARMDGEIDPIQRAALDAHVETCLACASELGELQSMRYAVRGEMPYYKAPPDLRNRVRFALRGSEYLDTNARRIDWRVWGAVAAGVVLCALATAPFLINARNQSQLVAEEFLSAHERAL